VTGLSPETIAGFALTSAIIEMTPGPNMTWLAVVAVTEGRRAGYSAVAGVCLGLAFIGLAAAFGMATVIADYPAVYQAMRWAGVAYLLWLAWDAWRDAGAAEEPEAGQETRFFWRGLVTNMLNPKAALFYLAVLPGFVAPGTDALTATVILTLIYVVIATLIHAGIVTLAGAARGLLENPDRERRVRRVLAAALALVAVWFVVASRTGLPA
jgi:threonine/homoserine/homoserine lactone efflux protein